MTPAKIAASQIRDRFANIAAADVDALRSAEGLVLDIDGVAVAVWHRQEDNMIVAFANPDHPDDGEQWAELPLPAVQTPT